MANNKKGKVTWVIGTQTGKGCLKKVAQPRSRKQALSGKGVKLTPAN